MRRPGPPYGDAADMRMQLTPSEGHGRHSMSNINVLPLMFHSNTKKKKKKKVTKVNWTHLLIFAEEMMCSGPKSLAVCDR